jgi:benzoate-CoA ligase
MVSAFVGAMLAGSIPVPLSSMLRPEDYGYYLADSRARALVVHASLLPLVQPHLDAAPHLSHVLVTGGPPQTEGQVSFDRLLADAPPDRAVADTSKDDMAFWLYSSGSTGAPKATVHLHHDIPFCVETYGRQVLGLRADDVCLSAAKLFFAYGLGNSLYFPFAAGATTVLLAARPLPETVLAAIARHSVTVFFGVPTLFASLLHAAERDESIRCPSLRFCASAGESLPAPLCTHFQERFGVEVLDGIGSTEALHIFISNRHREVVPGSSGRVVPGYEARIVDDAGRDLAAGEVGNLLLKGDSTTPFYWNKHDKSKATVLGEWLVTGDKFLRDEHDVYWYQGRSDDMLKVGGLWVSPAEVESVILEHPAVLESAVVALTDADGLVKPRAFVVLKREFTAGEGLAIEIRDFVKGKLAPFKCPRSIAFVDDLPRTATGKIQRFKLRQD